MKVVPEDVSTAPLKGLASAPQLTTVTESINIINQSSLTKVSNKIVSEATDIGITYFHKLVQLDSKLHHLV